METLKFLVYDAGLYYLVDSGYGGRSIEKEKEKKKPQF